MSRHDEINRRADAALQQSRDYQTMRQALHDNELHWRSLDSFLMLIMSLVILIALTLSIVGPHAYRFAVKVWERVRE